MGAAGVVAAVCAVEGCARPPRSFNGRLHSRFCPPHEQRKTKHGSPTARVCRNCLETVDDRHRQNTHLLGGTFTCSDCLLDPVERRVARRPLPPGQRRPTGTPCAILGCTRRGRVVTVRYATGRTSWRCERHCSAHLKRKERYGSFTARRCQFCPRVVDDARDETGVVTGRHDRYTCLECLCLQPSKPRNDCTPSEPTPRPCASSSAPAATAVPSTT